MELTGKTVLITGASEGLGAATARTMSARGAELMLLARTEAKLEALAGELAATGGSARIYPVDLSDLGAVERTTEAIKAEGSIPDVIVNNAGVGRWLFIHETSLDELEAFTAVPYVAAFAVTRGFIAEMAARGSGNVCNINGPGAWFPWPGSIAYASARFALRGFSTALRVDLRGTGVSVTDVVMGKISSSYWENNAGTEARIPPVSKLIPTLSPERAAEVVTRAVERERRLATAPAMYSTFHHLGRVFPGLVHRAVTAGGPRWPDSGDSANEPARKPPT